ncbi:MAG TPA: anaerobic ribonucleoside-triphosphate reductase activating protein [Lachnospiraceae bacterium]|nr:anaerobic ribonucleoside-triphosphate reductase activating protein [Lachnospiraceae bacterium]
MRYHNITKDDMLNGDGLRAVLWLSGCDHHCKGCQNPLTWDPEGGLLFDEKAKEELFDILKRPYISGITFTGGDPLHKGNVNEVGKLIDEIKRDLPDKTIWLYTGDTWEDIIDIPFIRKADVVVDGEFIEDLKDNLLQWKGSKNQRVIDVKKTFKRYEKEGADLTNKNSLPEPVILYEDYEKDKNKVDYSFKVACSR